MLLKTSKLVKDRSVYIVIRGEHMATVEKYIINHICKDAHSHYLHVLPTNKTQEPLNVQISGAILPEMILTNTIFFNLQDAQLAMNASNIINKGRTSVLGSKGGNDIHCQDVKTA